MKPTKDQILVELECDVEDLQNKIKELYEELECDVEDLQNKIKELYEEKGKLLSEISYMENRLDDVRALLTEPPFPNTFYTSASDCLQHHEATGQPLTELERQLLIYASELEDILGGIEEGLS